MLIYEIYRSGISTMPYQIFIKGLAIFMVFMYHWVLSSRWTCKIYGDRISSTKKRGKWFNFQYQDDCNIATYMNVVSMFRTSTYVRTLRKLSSLSEYTLITDPHGHVIVVRNERQLLYHLYYKHCCWICLGILYGFRTWVYFLKKII